MPSLGISLQQETFVVSAEHFPQSSVLHLVKLQSHPKLYENELYERQIFVAQTNLRHYLFFRAVSPQQSP